MAFTAATAAAGVGKAGALPAAPQCDSKDAAVGGPISSEKFLAPPTLVVRFAPLFSERIARENF